MESAVCIPDHSGTREIRCSSPGAPLCDPPAVESPVQQVSATRAGAFLLTFVAADASTQAKGKSAWLDDPGRDGQVDFFEGVVIHADRGREKVNRRSGSCSSGTGSNRVSRQARPCRRPNVLPTHTCRTFCDIFLTSERKTEIPGGVQPQ